MSAGRPARWGPQVIRFGRPTRTSTTFVQRARGRRRVDPRISGAAAPWQQRVSGAARSSALRGRDGRPALLPRHRSRTAGRSTSAQRKALERRQRSAIRRPVSTVEAESSDPSQWANHPPYGRCKDWSWSSHAQSDDVRLATTAAIAKSNRDPTTCRSNRRCSRYARIERSPMNCLSFIGSLDRDCRPWCAPPSTRARGGTAFSPV